ncbi:MAG TPA: toll/interleukin-1 receptor domain-containing protein [Terriglobales bacterium]|nr:toll/interleukin-1 receptor domain-containing protein [Terriglobales bacterium]
MKQSRSRVFISHASEDGVFAESLVSEIRQDKSLRPWIDTEHITTGVNILSALRHALSSMDIFIILISQASLRSNWVREEVECALRKQIEGESLVILPFITDGTSLKEVESMHPFLLNRRVDRITRDFSSASFVVEAIHRETNLPREMAPASGTSFFQCDPEIEHLVKHVRLGNWDSALEPAFIVLGATDEAGNNELFKRLAKYQECPDEDLAWGARMVMETLVDLAPDFFDRPLLISMSRSKDFSVRGSAASICLALAQFAPDRVPVDVLMTLSSHDEDWYVTEPATAALKSICKDRPNVLQVFFAKLLDPDPEARAHAARAVRGIAAKEPEILDAERLGCSLNHLLRIGDKNAAGYLTDALQRVRATKRRDGYKYGLGG